MKRTFYTFLITSLLMSTTGLHCQDQPSQETPPTTVAPENNKQNSEGFSQTTIAIGGTVAGFALFKTGRAIIGLGVAATKALLRKPLITAPIVIFGIAPVLEETLFAEEPNFNAQYLAHKIKARWKKQKECADKNISTWYDQFIKKYNGTVQDIKINHPGVYEWFMRIDQQPVVQDIKEGAQALKSYAQPAYNSFTKWIDEPGKQEEKP